MNKSRQQVLGLLIACVVVGCAHRGEEQFPSEVEALANREKSKGQQELAEDRGREVYNHYCAICHGAEGAGDGFNATSLELPPRNFTDRAFQDSVDENHLIRVVTDGGESVGRSVLMPRWGRTLSERQIEDVVAYVRAVAAPSKSEVDSVN